MPAPEIHWLDEPEEHDYPAARSYLELVLGADNAARAVEWLKKVDMASYKAKDIFRSSRLPMLGTDNHHVEKNLRKMQAGKKLSPILLVTDIGRRNLIIADGYHRMCSAYHVNEDVDVPCKRIEFRDAYTAI